MATKYDPNHIARYYDDYAEREWARFGPDAGPSNLVNFHLHRLYLQQYIQPGSRVLEAGAGPGRFTIELAKLGAAVTVGDISPRQLELNREHVRDAGCEQAVTAWRQLDIVDLSDIPSESFDAVVCYGGVISYVLDRAEEAIGELLRVTKVGGYLLISVMSLIGSTRALLGGILSVIEQFGLEPVQHVQTTGDLYGEVTPRGHHCHMFKWSELEALLNRHSCRIVAASASNFLSLANDEALSIVASDRAKSPIWQAFLGWETEYCKEPGALDGGTHIIAVVQRT
ncbi:MAG: class I SAM-dependent methyltransferase [Chloroflexota bacterium]